MVTRRSTEDIEIREVEAEQFRKAKFRLLHCQIGYELISADMAEEAKGWKVTYNSKKTGENSTCCGSVWKPGWGLHSDRAIVELKFRKDARVVVWTHDGSSEVASKYSSFRKETPVWGDRQLGQLNFPKFFRSVARPEELGVTKKALSRRSRADGLTYSDPVNEMWFKLIDVIAIRAIIVQGHRRSDGIVDTQKDLNKLRIQTASSWYPFSLEKILKNQ